MPGPTTTAATRDNQAVAVALALSRSPKANDIFANKEDLATLFGSSTMALFLFEEICESELKDESADAPLSSEVADE